MIQNLKSFKSIFFDGENITSGEGWGARKVPNKCHVLFECTLTVVLKSYGVIIGWPPVRFFSMHYSHLLLRVNLNRISFFSDEEEENSH